MTEAEHNKGPWYQDGPAVYADDGQEIAIMSSNPSLTATWANASLIASAPETAAQRDELLAALEVTVKRFMDEGYDAVNFEEAIAAIANAKGETA